MILFVYIELHVEDEFVRPNLVEMKKIVETIKHEECQRIQKLSGREIEHAYIDEHRTKKSLRTYINI